MQRIVGRAEEARQATFAHLHLAHGDACAFWVDVHVSELKSRGRLFDFAS